MANLWDRAATNMSEEDKQVFRVDDVNKKRVLQDILSEFVGQKSAPP